MRSNRAMTLLVVAGSLTLGAVGAADSPGAHRPGLGFASGTPQDVRALARRTWVLFTDAFPARWGCLGGLTVRAAWRLADRAEYQPAGHRATIRIPGTAPNLQASLVHEFAHHLDFSCPDAELRARFLTAQGMAPARRWDRGPSWDRTPSEQFAEAAVLAVLGETAHPLIVTHVEAVRVIDEWGEGR